MTLTTYYHRRHEVACKGKIVGWISEHTHNAVPANRGKWMGRCTTASRNRFNMDSKDDAVRFVQRAHCETT